MTKFVNVSDFANSEQYAELFGSKQSDDCMGTYTEVVGWKACPESCGTFFGKGLRKTVWYTIVGVDTIYRFLFFVVSS